MSLPNGRTSYFGRFEDPEKFRLIHEYPEQALDNSSQLTAIRAQIKRG